MSAAFQERFTCEELHRIFSRLSLNAAFPTLFLWYERIAYNTDLRGYLDFAHDLAHIGLLPPDAANRQWTEWESIYRAARPGANFGYEAQAYTLFIIPVIFLAWAFSRETGSGRNPWAFRSLAAFLFSGLLISLSRTGIFTFVLCLFLFVPGRRKFVLAGSGAAIVMALLALFPNNYFLQRYTMQSSDAYPMAAKLVQIQVAFQSVFSSPISLFLGDPHTIDKAHGGSNPHNQFMYDLMTKGLIGMSAGVAMFAVAFRRLADMARAKRGDENLVWAVRIGLVSVFITCFSTQVLIYSNTGLVFWFLLFAVSQMDEEKRLYLVRFDVRGARA